MYVDHVALTWWLVVNLQQTNIFSCSSCSTLDVRLFAMIHPVRALLECKDSPQKPDGAKCSEKSRSVCLSALARFTTFERVSKEKTSSEMITESVYAVRMSIKRTQTTLNSIRWKSCSAKFLKILVSLRHLNKRMQTHQKHWCFTPTETATSSCEQTCESPVSGCTSKVIQTLSGCRHNAARGSLKLPLHEFSNPLVSRGSVHFSSCFGDLCDLWCPFFFCQLFGRNSRANSQGLQCLSGRWSPDLERVDIGLLSEHMERTCPCAWK